MATPLHRARVALGKTQREVALAVGIDPGQYSRIENAKERITPLKAAEVARYFNGKIDEMELLYPERYPDPCEESSDPGSPTIAAD